PTPTLFPYTTLFRSLLLVHHPFVGVRRVLEERRPMQRVERTYLDADPAVHAQAVVDREAVEFVDGLAASGLGGLVAFDVDAPARSEEHTSELQSPYD